MMKRRGFTPRSSLGDRVLSSWAGWNLACAAAGVLSCLAIPFADATAQCILVRERGGPEYAPHFVVHFGNPSDLPRTIQCATSLDKNLPAFCVPVYAYNLWDGADAFDLALRTPEAPLAFDPGPSIASVQMDVSLDVTNAVTRLQLQATGTLCGPVYLGCLRLASASLPESFQVTFTEPDLAGRRAAHGEDGLWRTAIADAGGARIAPYATCTGRGCGVEAPIRDLAIARGEQAGIVDLSWTPGSGNYTMLRLRMDGRYPTDPWDGELLAALPSSVTHFPYRFQLPGEARIAAWSVTRNPTGNLYAASNVECGSLASLLVQLPVAITSRGWGQVKTLFR
jgi:hypothetical protein